MKLRYIMPFAVFLLIFVLLWRGLSLHPNEISSPLINKSAPAFELGNLFDSGKKIDNSDFVGHVTLLNVWATDCYACAQEHYFLVELAKTENIIFYGLAYKDDAALVKQWLEKYGNPYRLVAVDQNGRVAIDWGVYGTPETFIIDKKGIIRYKQIGPITADVWENKLKNIVAKLERETP